MDVKTTYWIIALTLVTVWAALILVPGLAPQIGPAAAVTGIGPFNIVEFLPIPAVIMAATLGSTLSGKVTEKLVPWATGLCEKAQAKRIPLDVAEEFGTHIGMSIAISSAFIVTAIPALLSMGFGPHMFLLALAAVPIIPSAVSHLSWSNRVSERKERTDWELPFFTVYATILAHCGLTLYASMKMLTKTGRRLFQQMASESEDVERLAELTGRGVVESLEAHASNHPHEGFQSLIYSTTSVWRMGGSLVSTLEDRATEFLKALEERYDRFATLVAAVMEAFIILLLLLPMGLVLTAVTSPGQSGVIITVMTLGVIPSTGLMMYFFVSSKSPRHLDDIKPRPLDIALSIAFASAAIPPLLLIGAPMTLLFTVPTAIGSLSFWLRMRGLVRELRESDSEARRWLKDVTEYRRLGNPPSTAIMKTANHRYRRSFKKVLDHIISRMSMGLTIWEAGASVARSWLLRMSLYLLHAINLSGGGSPFLMDKLVELLRSYNLAREKAAGRISPFKYLAIAMPLITAVTIGMVLPLANLGGIFQTSEAGGAIVGAGGGNPPLAAVTPEEMFAMADAGMVMIAVGGLFYIMIVNRAVDGHPYNTWRIALVMAVTAASYYLMVPVGNIMLSMFKYG